MRLNAERRWRESRLTTLLTTTRRKLLGNMAWLYLLQGLNYLIPIAVLPYLLRVLGIERYGLIAFAQAFAQYFVLITDYGFNLSATKHIARIRDDREGVSRLFWCVILIKLALLVLGGAVMAGVVLAIPRFRADAELYAIAYVAVLGTVLFTPGCFREWSKWATSRWRAAGLGSCRRYCSLRSSITVRTRYWH